MSVLDGLEPREVFRYFEEIAGIPHGSRNTKAIRDYLVEFANKNKLEVYSDEANNVVIKKPATQGYEGHDTVILQGHIDMVCEKEADCSIDMAREPICLQLDGETVTADGTTLGGDDGIAVAMMLAVLESEIIQHPPVEAVFTSDEEIGMLGAQALDMSLLSGRQLINIDSEDEGILTCGCAGGATVTGHIPVEREAGGTGEVCRLVIDGLKGGHSGIEIDKNHANGHILLGRLLEAIEDDYYLLAVTGGTKDNAIPARAEATVMGDITEFTRVVNECQELFRHEYRLTDPGITITLQRMSDCADKEKTEALGKCFGGPMTTSSRQRVITALRTLPNGIQRMSADVDGLVQTSLNMGILKTRYPEESPGTALYGEKSVECHDEVTVGFSVRSALASEKKELIDRTCRILQLLDGSYEITGDYPGWEYRQDSPLRDHMVAVYEQMYGEKPVVDVIHAGLECGYFSEKIPGLDAVSMGPDLRDVHTPKESMDTASVKRVWEYLIEVLKGM